MDGSCALGLALGHVRNAAAAFVAAEDDSGESLFVAAECLELEGLFADFHVIPVPVDAGLGGVESLQAAAVALGNDPTSVPLTVWVGVEALRARVSR